MWKVLVVSAILGVCATFPIYMSIPEQCVLCRAECVNYHIFGMTFVRGLHEDGEFTRWYVTHRPPHTHLWHCSHPGCLPDRNFFGLPLTLYMMRGHPVLHLTASQELQFAKQADEMTLLHFFADAASPQLEEQSRAAGTVRNILADAK